MATKSDFTADEWKTLLESPLLAGFAISAADPSGFFGTIKEGWAEAKELAAARTGAGDESSRPSRRICSPPRDAPPPARA